LRNLWRMMVTRVVMTATKKLATQQLQDLPEV
jgi:hypothetical protein